MSATATAPKKTEHSDEVKAKLRKAGLSEGSEMSAAKLKAVEALPDDASAAAITAAVHGKKTEGKARKVSVSYPDDVRAAYKRALELTGDPDHGGPKYPLTVKQADAIKRALAAKGKAVGEANAGLEKVSDATLRKMAKGNDAPADQVKAVRVFLKAHKALKEDRTMYGRKGAAIVLAYREAA